MSLALRALNWNHVLPAAASTHRADLHLTCGNEVIFYDPVNAIGCLWRPLHQVAQITGPISAAEFVTAMLARSVAFPAGPTMQAWGAAITGGLVLANDASTFKRIAEELEYMAVGVGISESVLH